MAGFHGPITKRSRKCADFRAEHGNRSRPRWSRLREWSRMPFWYADARGVLGARRLPGWKRFDRLPRRQELRTRIRSRPHLVRSPNRWADNHPDGAISSRRISRAAGQGEGGGMLVASDAPLLPPSQQQDSLLGLACSQRNRKGRPDFSDRPFLILSRRRPTFPRSYPRSIIGPARLN